MKRMRSTRAVWYGSDANEIEDAFFNHRRSWRSDAFLRLLEPASSCSGCGKERSDLVQDHCFTGCKSYFQSCCDAQLAGYSWYDRLQPVLVDESKATTTKIATISNPYGRSASLALDGSTGKSRIGTPNRLMNCIRELGPVD